MEQDGTGESDLYVLQNIALLELNKWLEYNQVVIISMQWMRHNSERVQSTYSSIEIMYKDATL